MNSIAFLGVGTMGGGMAARLVGAGFTVTVWNRHPFRAQTLAERGARVAASPREAATGADLIISMVADDAASRAVWLGPDGAIAGAQRDAILVESSTLSPEWILELDKLARARGCAFLDAPVTGSRTHAAAGELLFLVGGSAATIERARPALEAMSRGIVHVGPTGSGARLKLINNFLCGVQAAALAEAVALIERLGLDYAKAFPVLADGAPGSPLVKAVGARMAAHEYAVNFALALMHKDLTYAMAEGARVGVPLRTAETARALFAEAINARLGDADFSAVVEPLRGPTS
ncbi:MAG TPA: NAD(P)-dependent oxidoreductase [Vicinamibacterales bacterium]|nr:NAD(P)-dependent oxidoreductase [Vicinamibacterales bacterium]